MKIKSYTDSKINNGFLDRKSNQIMGTIIRLFFRSIDLDKESLSIMGKNSNDGKAIFISQNRTITSLLILKNALRKHDLPSPDFAIGFRLYWIQIISSTIKKAFSLFSRKGKNSSSNESELEFLKDIINSDKNIILSLLSKKLFKLRYLYKETDVLENLILIQNSIDTPIYIYPQMIFWNRNPERTKALKTFRATGDKGFTSALLTIIKSRTQPFIKISEPVNLKAEIEKSQVNESQHIARIIRNRLLDVYDHEKRTVLGPIIKSTGEMMEKILYHDNVLKTITELSGDKGISEKKLRKQAMGHFREIAADFSIVYIRFFEKTLSIIFKKIFNGIEYDNEDFTKLRNAAQKGPLILLPSHKSHMDYLVISSLFYQNNLVPPHIVSGANLTFFPMGKIFRRSGAFFMRRSFRGMKLYSVVFRQYVKTLVHENYSIEFFLEGTRTRTGKQQHPKMGILKYLIESIHEGYNSDLQFVPISVNYDRLLEESIYQSEIKGKEKSKESTSGFIKSRKLLKRKYGKVYLKIDNPISYKKLREKYTDDSSEISDLSYHLSKRINEITTVTPFSLVTTVMLSMPGRGFSKDTLNEKIEVLLNYLTMNNHPVPEDLSSKAGLLTSIDYIMNAYLQDSILTIVKDEGEESENINQSSPFYVINEEQRPKINFYKNSIIQYFLPLSFLSLSILKLTNNENILVDDIKTEFTKLMDLFSKEFLYLENMYDSDKIINDSLHYLKVSSLLLVNDDTVMITEKGLPEIQFYGKIIQEIIESFYTVSNAITTSKSSIFSHNKLISQIRKNGVRLYHTDEIKLIESLSMLNYKGAVKMLTEHEILKEAEHNKKEKSYRLTDKNRLVEIEEELSAYLEDLSYNYGRNKNKLKQII